MDSFPKERRKNSDKAKEKFERTGGKTSKHIRQQLELVEKRLANKSVKPKK
jgi:hypothetical protein